MPGGAPLHEPGPRGHDPHARPLRGLSRRTFLASAAAAGCTAPPRDAAAAGGNFSQRPGFAAWFAANPPATTLPAPGEQALLRRWLPRFFLAPGEQPPLDFYADYVAHGGLDGGTRRQATPALLNARLHDPAAVFVHDRDPDRRPRRAVAYGRVDRDLLALDGTPPRRLTFLTWNLAFAVSGLPAAMPGWLEAAASLVADPQDWHQLDHYTALCLALDERLRPFAATFQQHNTQRTWLLGDGLLMPADGRLEVAIARRSNELYPRPASPVAHRTIGIPDAGGMRYLMGDGERPFMAADDVVEPGREIEVELDFLPPADAFYMFEGYLGERRALPGRDGPPGAAFNTLPALKPKALQMLAGFWRENEEGDLARLEASWAATGSPRAFALAQAPVFLERWQTR
ncbi:hypothetical protein SH611_14760 [Geminicoccaceae bacterium 1502E]|nr:hypothetical protein [Geminicoccaceae bacterium 1502E]